MSKEKPKDILEEVKKIEKIVKLNLLIRALKNIKQLARWNQENQEKMNLILKEIGLETQDVKKVIEFVGNLPETQLTEEDKKVMKEQTRKDIKGDKRKVEEKIEERPLGGTSTCGESFTYVDGSAMVTSATTGESLNIAL